jgi:hypothetical protein
MTCREFRDVASELVEGALDASARAEAEAHLAACESCRVLAGDLQRIRQTAASLERRPLPRSAWAGLVSRLNEEDAARGGAQPAAVAAPRTSWVPSWAWLGAAALVVLATGLGVWTVARMTPAPGVTQDSQPPAGNAAPGSLVESIENELQMAASHYEKAIQGLEQIASASDSPIDPVLMATVKENLAVIDQAIEESRVALRTEPTSQVAQENLFEAFRRKIGLLQDTIALMNEMRQGDEAGAARIVENLKKS